MLAAIILVFIIFAWLGHRDLTRIVIPELRSGDWGDHPFVPEEARGNNVKHGRSYDR